MEGERILKDLLKKKLDGLHDDTKNYIATLTRVLENKNGYQTSGCNTVEEVVSKYSGFCSKFLRCAIEILKGTKDTNDYEEIVKMVNLVMKVLDKVLSHENGKYLKWAPSLDDIGRKLLHITNHLLNKNLFDASLHYVNYCIKYLKLSRNTIAIEPTVLKELKNVATHMGSLSWKGAQRLEMTSQSKVKDTHEHLGRCTNVLKWRLNAIMFEAFVGSLNSDLLVTKVGKSISKFQMDCGPSCRNCDCDNEIVTLFESVFGLFKEITMEQHKSGRLTTFVFPLFDLGFNFARTCHHFGLMEEANTFYERLQSLASEVVKPKKANTAEGCLISRFYMCCSSLSKATMLVDVLCQQCTPSPLTSTDFERLNKLLDEGSRLLDLLLQSRAKTPFPLSSILQSQECLRVSLQTLYSILKDKHEASKLLVSCKTFQSILSLLEQYGVVLQSELNSASVKIPKKLSTHDSSALYAQLKQQLQKLVDRQLSLTGLISKWYQLLIQDGFKEMTGERHELMSRCFEHSKQRSTQIHLLMSNPSVCLSNNELMWHGSLTFSLGMEAYRQNLFKEGAALMSLGCSDLKDWCLLVGDDRDTCMVASRLQELLPKYGALVDCQKRAKLYEDAFASATTSMALFLRINQESLFSSMSTELQNYVQLWIKAKHDFVKHSCDDKPSDIRSRTLCTVIADQEDILNVSNGTLACLLQVELRCYKLLTKRYDTLEEQFSVTKQLMKLYSVEDDSLNLAAVMLQHARAIHSSGNTEWSEKSPLDMCRESISLLESLIQDSSTEEDLWVTIQDQLASAYLWQCILQHEEVMRQNVTVYKEMESVEVSNVEDMEQDEEQVISMEQSFVPSLHAAVDMWTVLVENCLKKSKDGKVDVSVLANPDELSHQLQTAALLYGILNQPLNQVHALHLCAVISQAIGTQDAVNNAIVVYTQALHTLCVLHDLDHAHLIVSYCDKIAERNELGPAALVQLWLAKSHICLESGRFSEGETYLNTALASKVLSQKTCLSVVLMALTHSLMAKYLQLPAMLYSYQPPKGLANDQMTPLDAALDGISKLENIVFTVFGQKVSDLNTTTCITENELINPDISIESNLLLVVYNLLMFQLQCGAILAHQGMVRQAIKYLADGLHLSKTFALPYRVTEFMLRLSHVNTQRGDLNKAREHLLLATRTLALVLQDSPDRIDIEHCPEIPPVVNHPRSCQCICCSDPTVQSIQIEFFLTTAKYLGFKSKPKDSIRALEITDTLISNAMLRMETSLEGLTNTLRLGSVNDESYQKEVGKGTAKKKGRQKTANAKQSRKASKKSNADLHQTSQAMFSSYLVQVFAHNAEILIDNGKSRKALDAIATGTEIIHDMERITGCTPFYLVHLAACLYHLKGVVHLIEGLGKDSEEMDSIWGFSGNSACEHKVAVSTNEAIDVIEEKPKRGRGRSAKSKACSIAKTDSTVEPSVEKTTARGNSRGKKVAQQAKKTEGRAVGRSGRRESIKEINQECEIQLAVDMFTKALDLCCCWPQPQLYSQLCQSLVLCYGRAQASSAVHYLNLSFGVTLRYEAANCSRKKIRKLSKDYDVKTSLTNKLKSMSIDSTSSTSEAISLQDTRELMMFKSHLTQLDINCIPKEWTVCTLVSLKTAGHPKQMLISRQRPGKDPILVKVPFTDVDDTDGNDSCVNGEANQAVLDFSKLFQGTVEDEFSDVMQSSLESMGISNDKEWCQRRSTLDQKLKGLLERLENSRLGMWKGILLGQRTDASCSQETLEQASKELVERLEELSQRTVDKDLIEILLDSNHHLTTTQRRDALSLITGVHHTSLHYEEVLHKFEKCASSLVPQKKRTSKEQKGTSMVIDRHPVILILGKDIQHLPWESIPTLREHQVTRMPSMHFIVAQATKAKAHGKCWVVDPNNTFYVLNPEDNLPNTQKIFQNWFESESNWHGVTGKKPTQDQYKSALMDHELFLYLGHGSGRSFLKGDDVQRITCRATTILMGCSSAKLMVDGVCEPRGMSLNYLLAGCPAILGNLWDVTDRDIDRFTKSLLQAWLDGDQHLSLLQFIKTARQACKLPYLIGASPVVHGIPVFLEN